MIVISPGRRLGVSFITLDLFAIKYDILKPSFFRPYKLRRSVESDKPTRNKKNTN